MKFLDIYLLARKVLRANPGAGKQELKITTVCLSNSGERYPARYQGKAKAASAHEAEFNPRAHPQSWTTSEVENE